jgi:hypothetical protein
MNRNSNHRKPSIWRPIASAKAILDAESNVLKAQSIERTVLVGRIDQRVCGERKDRFYRKAILAASADNGITWQKLMGISLAFLLFTIALIHYEFINLKLLELSELLPTWDNVSLFFSKLTLSNFMQTMGELGLKVTRLEK